MYASRGAYVLSLTIALLFWVAPATAEPVSTCPIGDYCPVCGDGICDPGESCPQDCDLGGTCGNGICDAGETCSSCPGDCGVCGPVCGNGICEVGESCSSCSQDCSCATPCGNGVCDTGLGETCSNCPNDCGPCKPKCDPPDACKPPCGDGVCEPGETSLTCPDDCGSICGDNKCDSHETCNTCAFDCCPFGGEDDSPCTKNTECYQGGGFKCDSDIGICCIPSDPVNPRVCNPYPEMSSLPKPQGAPRLAVHRTPSLPAWLAPASGNRCRAASSR